MKWQYGTRAIDRRELVTVLNALGAEGWEVCGIMAASATLVELLLKRKARP